MDSERSEVKVGPGRLWVHSLPPWVWRPRAEETAGAAGLCLELLAAAEPAWEGVAEAGGGPAACGPAAWERLPAAAAEPLLAGLCGPWLSPAEEAEAAALERHLAAAADFPGLSCAACREQEAAGEAPPDCGRCPLPPPPAGAEAAFALHRLLAGLPAAAAPLAAELAAGLPPRRRRLTAVHLAALGRWSRRRGAAQAWEPPPAVLD
jgi:hypothetical protein